MLHTRKVFVRFDANFNLLWLINLLIPLAELVFAELVYRFVRVLVVVPEYPAANLAVDVGKLI